MKLNHNEKDKQIEIQKRWKYLNKTKFMHLYTKADISLQKLKSLTINKQYD